MQAKDSTWRHLQYRHTFYLLEDHVQSILTCWVQSHSCGWWNPCQGFRHCVGINIICMDIQERAKGGRGLNTNALDFTLPSCKHSWRITNRNKTLWHTFANNYASLSPVNRLAGLISTGGILSAHNAELNWNESAGARRFPIYALIRRACWAGLCTAITKQMSVSQPLPWVRKPSHVLFLLFFSPSGLFLKRRWSVCMALRHTMGVLCGSYFM